MTRALAALLALALLALALLGGTARAEEVVIAPTDDQVRIRSSSHCVTDGGTDLRLPPGYFLPEAKYNALDAELRRLQDEETRLAAENLRLRDLTGSQSDRTFRMLGLGLLAGTVVGLVAGYLAAQ